MRVYNSLSGEKEVLRKPFRRKLKLFVCGPTVYDYSHIGHARTYLVFDSFVRYLRSSGFKVFYLENITDVDDKIIARAKEEGKKPKAVADFFENAYYEDMKALGIEAVDRYARASDFIPEIVKQVKTLLKKGYAYKIDGDLPAGQTGGFYFDVSKFKNYGQLSKRTSEQAEDAVSRIDESVRKKNRADFALWKFYEGDPSWETELGRGRPGWHIEDTAITEKFFGPQYDIHGGAVDLKFPHHEAEIAQQESASGKSPFVKIWMHTGFLLVNGEKMSKSLKNFITIRDFLKSYPADVLRWLVLSAHYRSPLNFSWELAAQAASSFQTVEDFLGKLDFVRRVGKSSVARRDLAVLLRESRDFFEAALADDFNTPAALAQIFGLATKFQKDLWGIKPTDAKKIYEHVVALIKKLGINIKNSLPPAKVSDLVEKRELLRSNKQFIEADALRQRIKQLGYEIEDTPLGPWLKPVSNFHPKI